VNETDQSIPETATLTQEEPHAERPRREPRPLTHKISPGQLEGIRRCLVDPAEQTAQNHRTIRHKKNEGNQRPPTTMETTTMHQEQLSGTSTNGSQVQPTPPSVPQQAASAVGGAIGSVGGAAVGTMAYAATLPYKAVALRGLLLGAVAGTVGTLCAIGVKKLVARFSSEPAADEFLG
jgi:hypothetical protein